MRSLRQDGMRVPASDEQETDVVVSVQRLGRPENGFERMRAAEIAGIANHDLTWRLPLLGDTCSPKKEQAPIGDIGT